MAGGVRPGRAAAEAARVGAPGAARGPHGGGPCRHPTTRARSKRRAGRWWGVTEAFTLLAFMNAFAMFRASSWDTWRTELAQLTPEIREYFIIAGRGCGKSVISALV